MPSTESNNDWHLERKVTILLIIAVFANFASTIWWAASIDSTIKEHAKAIIDHRRNIELILKDKALDSERLARIEERTSLQMQILGRLEDNIQSIRNEKK